MVEERGLYALSTRNHQGLGNELIETTGREYLGDGPVECQERLGGLLRYYRRAA